VYVVPVELSAALFVRCARVYIFGYRIRGLLNRRREDKQPTITSTKKEAKLRAYDVRENVPATERALFEGHSIVRGPTGLAASAVPKVSLRQYCPDGTRGTAGVDVLPKFDSRITVANRNVRCPYGREPPSANVRRIHDARSLYRLTRKFGNVFVT